MREPGEPTVTWEADIPLLSRRGLLYWSVTVLFGAGIIAGILAAVFATGGEWDALPPMLAMVAAVASGPWVLGLAIMVVVFRGRYHVRCTVSARGIAYEDVIGAAGMTNRTGQGSMSGLGGPAASRCEQLGGILAMSCHLPFPETLAAEKSVANADVPILMCHVRSDPVVPIGMGLEAREELQAQGFTP